MFKVGDIIHNNNGEDYVVFYYNEELDRALLGQLNTPKPFYVGAYGLQKHYWSQGHYFMEDLVSAVKYVTGTEE